MLIYLLCHYCETGGTAQVPVLNEYSYYHTLLPYAHLRPIGKSAEKNSVSFVQYIFCYTTDHINTAQRRLYIPHP